MAEEISGVSLQIRATRRVGLLIRCAPIARHAGHHAAHQDDPRRAHGSRRHPARPRPRRRRRAARRTGRRDVRALRPASRHHRHQRAVDRQPARRTARDRARHLGRAGDAAVLPCRRRRGRIRLARRHAVGHLAVHPGAATVQAGVLVPRVLDARPRCGAVGARRGVRRCDWARIRGTALVPRRLFRGARVRPGTDPAANRPRCRRRRRVPARGGRGLRRPFGSPSARRWRAWPTSSSCG